LDFRELVSAKITPEPPPAYTASAAPSLDTIPIVEKHKTIFPDAAVRFTSWSNEHVLRTQIDLSNTSHLSLGCAPGCQLRNVLPVCEDTTALY
jgi:hypothetical protein